MKKYFPKTKSLITTGDPEHFKSLADVLVIPMNFWTDLKSGKSGRKLPEKKEYWWYVSCMSHGCDSDEDLHNPDFVVERPSAYIRSIAWFADAERIDRFLYYSLNYMYEFYPKKDPYNDIWAFSGNGDGTLYYPDRKNNRPIPSLRLFIWRQGANDYQYLKWMRDQQKQTWTKEIEALQSHINAIEINPKKYDELREKMGDYLNAN